MEKDFICSNPGDHGMTKCNELPHYRFLDTLCNETALPFSNNTPSNGSCVNWNSYYTECKPGDRNPFQGAISFDNIGLAWVAIFQVRHLNPHSKAVFD
jgi:voltage-dependent calcium channel T type alpha-1G